MAYNSNNRSERLLQGRRFTTDNLTLGQEAFTDVFDLGAGEIFTDDGLIPTGSSQLPYSGSSQDGGIVSGSVVNPSIASDVSVLKYHYRKKLKQAADGQREVYYFTTSDPASVSDTVTSDQLIESDQQTNFVSPKYIIASDSPNTTEASTPGYKVVVYKDTASSAGSISSSPALTSTYTFDYKTGVLTWNDGSQPSSNQFVYITTYQYVGRTLRSQIDDGSIGGGGSSDFTELTNVPSGLVSSSAQITITESQISDLAHFTSADVRGVMNTDSVVSSSAQVIQHLPSGTVSSSNQITISESQISDLTHTDVSSLNNFTSSVVLNSVTSSMSVATASFISDTFISESAARSGFGQGGGTSDYDELINVPSGIISSSAQITALGYSTTDNDNQTLSISGQTLTISDGNSVILPSAGGGGGSSIWTTGSQDPETYTHLTTSNNLQLTGSFDVLGDLTVNGKSIFTQTSASDNESAIVVNGRIKILEQQIEGYIASASIQIGNTRDSIDCGGFF